MTATDTNEASHFLAFYFFFGQCGVLSFYMIRISQPRCTIMMGCTALLPPPSRGFAHMGLNPGPTGWVMQ